MQTAASRNITRRRARSKILCAGRWNLAAAVYCASRRSRVPFEILSLARRVQELKPRVILEIGTARGGTLLIWSRIASESVISCDLQDMRAQEPLFTRFPPPGSQCRVTLLSGDSHAASFRARVAETLAGRQADFLFIDGDHREPGVTADYEDYCGFVRPGGLIAFHDIVENQPLETNQVNRLWRKLRDRPGTEELINDPKQCGFGIGVIRVPG